MCIRSGTRNRLCHDPRLELCLQAMRPNADSLSESHGQSCGRPHLPKRECYTLIASESPTSKPPLVHIDGIKVKHIRPSWKKAIDIPGRSTRTRSGSIGPLHLHAVQARPGVTESPRDSRPQVSLGRVMISGEPWGATVSKRVGCWRQTNKQICKAEVPSTQVSRSFLNM